MSAIGSKDMLGPYRLEEAIGQGSMGVVFRAIDTRNELPVAIKLLHAKQATDPDARARLLREARKAMALADSPHVVKVLEAGVYQEQAYMAMELVDGSDVTDWLGSRHPEARILHATRLLHQLAAGLGHAHTARIVHRDLKPANLLVDHNGALKILDFGLAKDLSLPVGESIDRVVGTPLYMAPELLRMVLGLEAMDPECANSPRLDVYSAALTGVELLVGYNPFAAKSSYGALLTAKSRPLRHIAAELRKSGLPKQPIRALQACLHHSPASRPGRFDPFAALQPCDPNGRPSQRILSWTALGAAMLFWLSYWFLAVAAMAATLWVIQACRGRGARVKHHPAPTPSRRGTGVALPEEASLSFGTRAPLADSSLADDCAAATSGLREIYRLGGGEIAIGVGPLTPADSAKRSTS